MAREEATAPQWLLADRLALDRNLTELHQPALARLFA
jgi:hypothetical protein